MELVRGGELFDVIVSNKTGGGRGGRGGPRGPWVPGSWQILWIQWMVENWFVSETIVWSIYIYNMYVYMCCFTCFTILVQDSWGTSLSISFMAACKPPDVMLQNAGSQLCCPESAGPNKKCLCPSQGPSMKWKPSTSSDNSLKVGKCWEFDLHTDLTAESYEINWNYSLKLECRELDWCALTASRYTYCKVAEPMSRSPSKRSFAVSNCSDCFWFLIWCNMCNDCHESLKFCFSYHCSPWPHARRWVHAQQECDPPGSQAAQQQIPLGVGWSQ